MNARRYLKLVTKHYANDIKEFSYIHLKRFIYLIFGLMPALIGIFLICNYNDVVFTTYDASNVKNIVEYKTTCKGEKLIKTKVPYFLYKTPEPQNDHSHGRYYKFDGELKKTSGWFLKDVVTQKICYVDNYNKETKTIVIKNMPQFFLMVLYLVFWVPYTIYCAYYICLTRPHQHDKPYYAYYIFNDYYYEDQKYYGVYRRNVKSTLNYIFLYIKLFFNIPMSVNEIERRLSLSTYEEGYLIRSSSLSEEELKEFNEIRAKHMDNKMSAI